MKTTTTKREFEKTKEIAREYSKKGFKVIVEPKHSDLPEKIRGLNFQPDIIATSESINLIIEVKTSESIKDSRLQLIADEIKSVEGWDFELVYTNPKSKSEFSDKVDFNSYHEAKENLKRAASFLDTDASKNFGDAGLMLVWGAIEGILRANYNSYKKTERNITPKALLRDSVILGIIGRKEHYFLESMMIKRNQVAHGIFTTNIQNRELMKLVKVGNELLSQL
jgi:hypothetical protein